MKGKLIKIYGQRDPALEEKRALQKPIVDHERRAKEVYDGFWMKMMEDTIMGVEVAVGISLNRASSRTTVHPKATLIER